MAEADCRLLNSDLKGNHRQAQMAGSHCQGVGVGESPWRFGEGAEMETWQPDLASLAAGPRLLLLDGSARGLEDLGQVGIRTGSYKDRAGGSAASCSSHMQETPLRRANLSWKSPLHSMQRQAVRD